MQDTSFAIHPGNKEELKDVPYRDIGNMESFIENNNVLEFKCEQGYVDILFYRSDIVRVIMNPFDKPSLKSSFAVIKEPDKVIFEVSDEGETLKVETDKLLVNIKKKPFRISIYSMEDNRLIVKEGMRGLAFNEKKEVICYKEMQENDHFYGFGEKTGFLDKRGEKLTMWNSDVYAPHNPETDALYESIPYFMTVRNGKAHGIFFDNTFKTVFDLKGETDAYSFLAEGGQVDYYVLAGPTPKDVIKQYTTLTGCMPLPPKWAIGYHQSRYSYETEEEVRQLAKNFLEKEIPIDTIYLDIHYMDGYRVFTFDMERFPNPKQLIRDLKDVGIHVVPIVDPGVKEDPEYIPYQEGVRENHFCKYIDGKIYHGDVWPGNSAFPDFTKTETRNWWGSKHEFYTNIGIEGIWNDMNEPAVFNETKTMDVKVVHENDGDPRTHREMHNLYGLLMGEATYNGMKENNKGKRPFLLTRAGYAGVQRYGAVWTGDNRSFWEHLQMAIPMCMNLGISGVPFCGPDVGGFAHDSNGQLLARWTQVGAFTPYFRNHSALGFARQEPWSFGEKYEAIVKKYIQLRYKWLPHLYTLFHEASQTGLPVMRPLLMEYPNDKHTTNLSDQFMIGSNVIVAPILKPDTFHRVVYLPEGKWIDYWTGATMEGGKHFLAEADLETLPIYIKEGSFIAHGAVKQSTKCKETNMQIHLYPSSSGEASFTLYEDDGASFEYEKGSFLEKQLRCTFNNNVIELKIENKGNYKPDWNKWELVIHSKNFNILVNGVGISPEDQMLNHDEETITITLDDL